MRTEDANILPNGPAAAAIVAAGAGCCTMGVFYVAGNASPLFNRLFSIYKPSGALSGVSIGAMLVWLVSWILLDRRWRKQEVPMGQIALWSSLLLLSGLLLTFPPIARLF